MRARKRFRRWTLLGLIMVALGGFTYGMTHPPQLVAKFGIVDIDGYPRQTAIRACAKPLAPKPGVAAFRAMVLSQVGGRDDGLAVCKEIANNSGALSDHADGRAWDWHMVAINPSDQAMVDRVFDWLLRSDDRGHRNAMARRIGITYIIWNHLYYRVGSDNARWVPYTSTSDPHDTHVHFSFSVAGAAEQTSWWTERGQLTWLLSDESVGPFSLGEGPLIPLAGDWDGDGRDTVGAYNIATRQFTVWPALAAGEQGGTTPPLGPLGAIPIVGNWDGVGGDDVAVYDPQTRRFGFFFLSGGEARPSQVFGSAGDLPVVGDWNGDGIDDIGTYTPATRTFSRLMPDGSVYTRVFGALNDTPIVGDWNGDGVDGIGVFRSSTNTFYFPAQSVGGGAEAVTSITYAARRQLPVIGDWDGDGRDTEGVVQPG